MKKLRNIIFNSVCVKMIQKYLYFFALKGQPIFMQLLRCKALAVEYHSGAPHAVRYANVPCCQCSIPAGTALFA